MGVSIANLLRRYPAVGVPGIGVFRKTHRSASYDKVRSAFLPPADHIELVGEASDVFQLTDYLKAQQQVDGATATAMLEAAVTEMMDTISRNGEALLDGLGYLFADGASFVFKPFEIGRFAPESIPARLPVMDRPVSAAEEEEVRLTTEVEVDETPARKRYIPWIVWGTVAAMLIAAVAIWQYRPAWFTALVDPQVVSDPPADPQTPSLEALPLADAVQDSAMVDSSSVAAVDPTPIDSVSEAIAPATKPSVTYEIIVGSFATMRQADKFVAEMKAKGYDLHAIDSRMPGNRKKISWGSFATEEEAYKELARVQKTFEPGAWIAKMEHN